MFIYRRTSSYHEMNIEVVKKDIVKNVNYKI